MIYFIFVFLFLLLIGIIYLYVIHRKPNYYSNITLNDLKKYFAILLKRGHNGAFMVVELEKNDKLFLQAYKYIDNEKKGVVIDFPIADWSRPFIKSFLDCTENLGLNYKKVYTESENSNLKVECGYAIDFLRDVDLASKFLSTVFCVVFQAKADDKCKLYFWNVDPRDIEI